MHFIFSSPIVGAAPSQRVFFGQSFEHRYFFGGECSGLAQNVPGGVQINCRAARMIAQIVGAAPDHPEAIAPIIQPAFIDGLN